MASVTKTGIILANTVSESLVNPLDQQFYEEPDGSVWIRLIHHNNPANARFSQSNTFSSSVYLDADRWFYASIVNKITNNAYEFMLKQKTTSDATEEKYRWIQTVNPFTAVFGDVDAADVTKITTSGYSVHADYGGIYKFNTNSFFVANNSKSGNWYGALGCWSAYNGGIPGFAQKIITTGYMDLYLRVDNQTGDVASIFKNSISATQFIEF